MIFFLDTSALVKLYHEEAYSSELKSYLAEAGGAFALVIARLGVVEYTSTVWKKQRVMGAAQHTSAPTLLLLFEADLRLNRFDVVEADLNSYDTAVSILNRCNLAGFPLRSLDALQVAAALQIHEVLDEFITCDRRLAEAGAHLGLTVKYFGPAPEPKL